MALNVALLVHVTLRPAASKMLADWDWTDGKDALEAIGCVISLKGSKYAVDMVGS
jgi:hypothetical protein